MIAGERQSARNAQDSVSSARLFDEYFQSFFGVPGLEARATDIQDRFHPPTPPDCYCYLFCLDLCQLCYKTYDKFVRWHVSESYSMEKTHIYVVDAERDSRVSLMRWAAERGSLGRPFLTGADFIAELPHLECGIVFIDVQN